jgi:hypothetical protein
VKLLAELGRQTRALRTFIASNRRLRRLSYGRPSYIVIQTTRAVTWDVPLLNKITRPPELDVLARGAKLPGLLPDPGQSNRRRRILFCSARGQVSIVCESLIAAGVRARGADVHMVTCGGGLPICSFATSEVIPPPPCTFCRSYAHRVTAALRVPTSELRGLRGNQAQAQPPILRDVQPAQLPDVCYDGVPIGRVVRPAVVLNLLSDQLVDNDAATPAYRNFVTAGVPMLEAYEAVLESFKPDSVFMLNGLQFPDSVMFHLCLQRGIPVLTYEWAHRVSSLVFAWNAPAGFFESELAWSEFRGQPFAPEQRDHIQRYLNGRMSGAGAGDDIAGFWPQMERDAQRVRDRLRIDPGKSIITLFTNVVWDTAVYERDNAFEGMRQWLLDTVDAFAKWPELQLVIRIHPAEVRIDLAASRAALLEFLKKQRPSLPANVFVVPPESDVSSYALASMSSVGLVYASTMGLEMAAMGMPVIVAGLVHYAGKGFTFEVPSRHAYPSLLRQVLRDAVRDPDRAARALQYAYFFFFKLPVPFPLVDNSQAGNVRLDPDFMHKIGPGGDAGIDAVCEALLAAPDSLRVPLNAAT